MNTLLATLRLVCHSRWGHPLGSCPSSYWPTWMWLLRTSAPLLWAVYILLLTFCLRFPFWKKIFAWDKDNGIWQPLQYVTYTNIMMRKDLFVWLYWIVWIEIPLQWNPVFRYFESRWRTYDNINWIWTWLHYIEFFRLNFLS